MNVSVKRSSSTVTAGLLVRCELSVVEIVARDAKEAKLRVELELDLFWDSTSDAK